jgi:hypothetical protein
VPILILLLALALERLEASLLPDREVVLPDRDDPWPAHTAFTRSERGAGLGAAGRLER